MSAHHITLPLLCMGREEGIESDRKGKKHKDNLKGVETWEGSNDIRQLNFSESLGS